MLILPALFVKYTNIFNTYPFFIKVFIFYVCDTEGWHTNVINFLPVPVKRLMIYMCIGVTGRLLLLNFNLHF